MWTRSCPGLLDSVPHLSWLGTQVLFYTITLEGIKAAKVHRKQPSEPRTRLERPHPFSRWRTARALQGAALPRKSTRTWPRIGATERRGVDWEAEAKLPMQLSVMADRETGPQAGRHCQPPDVLPALKEQYPSPWGGPEGDASPAQMLPL